MTLMSHRLNVITGENIVINLSLHAYIYDNCPERLSPPRSPMPCNLGNINVSNVI